VRKASDSQPRQLPLDLNRTPSHAREDFIVSATNAAAVEAVDAWPRWPGGKLALIGPAGSGKTHLANEWAMRVGATALGLDRRTSLTGVVGPILIEDADRHRADEPLFHLFNRADAGATLLITGRTAPATWRVRLPDLGSRLRALTVAQIDPPDDELLLGVMRKLFAERNIRPTHGVGAYILQRIERSAIAVQEVVRRIDERAAEEKREVTLGLVREILGPDSEGGE
jgi:chromosomal replication initiation ATPase DnaA